MTPEEMLEFMPHRGRNVLIDRYEDGAPGSGTGWLRVGEGDAAGRDIFFQRAAGGPRYSHFFLVEHVALTSLLIVRHEMGQGRLAYFSTVSRFEWRGDAGAGEALVSRVSRGRDRGDFRSFRGEVATADGRPLLAVDIMAFLAPRGSLPPASPAKDDPAPPGGRFPCLDPWLVFTDDRGRGHFAHGNPLGEGHFPGSPTMMGMAQWLAVAERAAGLAPAGGSEITGSGAVTKPDGRPVTEVDGLAVRVEKDTDGRVLEFTPLSTRRVTFRERIMAGDDYAVHFTPA